MLKQHTTAYVRWRTEALPHSAYVFISSGLLEMQKGSSQ
jgi:hypothetical protein